MTIVKRLDLRDHGMAHKTQPEFNQSPIVGTTKWHHEIRTPGDTGVGAVGQSECCGKSTSGVETAHRLSRFIRPFGEHRLRSIGVLFLRLFEHLKEMQIANPHPSAE